MKPKRFLITEFISGQFLVKVFYDSEVDDNLLVVVMPIQAHNA